jgi:hypothetical protein
MSKKEHQDSPKYELDEYDKAHINDVFVENMTEKLRKRSARIGCLNCRFAGEAYRHWIIYFRSRGSGFEIVDFEYDENSHSLGLGL